VVVEPVDERHVDRSPPEPADGLEAAETSTDDDNSVASLVRRRPPLEPPCRAIFVIGTIPGRRGGATMIGWVGDIEQATVENETFRTVIFTGEHVQLTLMRLAPGEDIGRELHDTVDQFLRIEAGQARVELGRAEDTIDETHDVEADWAIVVPAGVWHNVVNTGTDHVKLYSLYSPPEHPDGTVHRTKAEAEAAETSVKE
jgi:mannose-6-phosphate isomerase-like protein (cupin superfamily)